MSYTDEYLIGEISAGGTRQERAITIFYEECYYLVRDGRKKYHQLDEDDLLTAYNTAVIAVRRQILREAFRGESALSTYLNRIFINRCIDIIRSKSSNPVDTLEHVPERPDETQNPLERWIKREQMERVQRMMQQIGEICRQILLLSEYEGRSAVEIAAAVGFSNANSVNSKKYTCLQKLRELMNAA